MAFPAIEVTFVNIGKATIEDESTKDGQDWLNLFVTGATTLPGCRRTCWGTSDKYPHIATHFIDYETAYQQYVHKRDDFNGLVSPPSLHHLIDPKTTDSVMIRPVTPDRSVLMAPDVHIHTFWGIDEDKFRPLAPEFFTAIAKSDSCTGYIWGEVQPNPLADPSGNAALGKGAILISGWTSREEHDRDAAKARVTESYSKLSTAVKKTDTWGMSVTVVENNGNVHKWRKLGTNKKPWTPVAAGLH